MFQIQKSGSFFLFLFPQWTSHKPLSVNKHIQPLNYDCEGVIKKSLFPSVALLSAQVLFLMLGNVFFFCNFYTRMRTKAGERIKIKLRFSDFFSVKVNTCRERAKKFFFGFGFEKEVKS
jgi:hypothetical protein